MNISAHAHARLVASDQVVARPVANETILLDLVTERYVSLDDVATRMYHVALAEPTLADATRALAVEYRVSEDRIAADLETLTRQLVDLGLASLQPGGASSPL